MRTGRLLTVARSYIACRKPSSIRLQPENYIGIRMAQESALFYAAACGWLLWQPLVLCPVCLKQVPWAVILSVREALLHSHARQVTVIENLRPPDPPVEPCRKKTSSMN